MTEKAGMMKKQKKLIVGQFEKLCFKGFLKRIKAGSTFDIGLKCVPQLGTSYRKGLITKRQFVLGNGQLMFVYRSEHS